MHIYTHNILIQYYVQNTKIEYILLSNPLCRINEQPPHAHSHFILVHQPPKSKCLLQES